MMLETEITKLDPLTNEVVVTRPRVLTQVGRRYMFVKTRRRVTEDGGQSLLAIEDAMECDDDDEDDGAALDIECSSDVEDDKSRVALVTP